MDTQPQWPVAIIGSGNIGTDLMLKIIRDDGPLTMGAMVGIEPASDGLARARRLNVPVTADGVEGLLAMPEFDDIKLVFDATSATAHRHNWAKIRETGRRVIDLTPAAIGPYCVPVVSLADHLDAPNLNMVTWSTSRWISQPRRANACVDAVNNCRVSQVLSWRLTCCHVIATSIVTVRGGF